MNKHATMRLAKWTPLSAPVDPMDTRVRYQAQSILHGHVRDSLPDTAAQARDVLAWYGRGYAVDAANSAQPVEIQRGYAALSKGE